MPDYEVTISFTIEASSPEQAILRAAALVDDGGGYRYCWRITNTETGVSNLIDAESVTGVEPVDDEEETGRCN